jgi:hypothetical protein
MGRETEYVMSNERKLRREVLFISITWAGAARPTQLIQPIACFVARREEVRSAGVMRPSSRR